MAATGFIFVLLASVTTAEYSGNIGWVFTGDSETNTAGSDAAVCGGDYNTAQGSGTVTLGGTYNSASGEDSFIGGGTQNTIEQVARQSMIGGGERNEISSRYSVIVGGLNNAISENYGIVLGGYKGAVSGKFGTIAGGSRNKAQGKFSTALGFKANALHEHSLALGFQADNTCETTTDSQISMCCDSWILNGVELMDLFSRRRERALTEQSINVLTEQHNSKQRKLGEIQLSDFQMDNGDSIVTTKDLEFHESRLENIQQANTELEKTIAMLSKEIDNLAALHSDVGRIEQNLERDRRRLAGAATEYIEDTSVTTCSSSELLSSSGSGLEDCAANCDALSTSCAAFMLDASDTCYTMYQCVIDNSIDQIEGILYRKTRTNPSAYDVDIVADADYQLINAEYDMDALEYDIKWGAIIDFADEDSCASGGTPYLAMDSTSESLYVCDGSGTWTQLALLDVIPAPAGMNEPAPWHNFQDIRQDAWSGTDTHTYAQSEPLEIESKPHDEDQCLTDPCENGGTCIDHGGALSINDPYDTFECNCPAGFEGITCGELIDDCSSNPCVNSATCTQDTYGYQCACVVGYEGFDCDVDINECRYGHCSHGTCVDGINSYTCECDAGWSGSNCDKFDLLEGYIHVGVGQCADSAGLSVDTCTSEDASVDTLFDCMNACNNYVECDGVQFRHETGLCGLALTFGQIPEGLPSHWSCVSDYHEIWRDSDEISSDWNIDPDGVLKFSGMDYTYYKAGSASFKVSGGLIIDSSLSYEMSIALTEDDGILAGVEYAVSVWVNHVSNVVASAQPSNTASTLTVSDSSRVFFEQSSASAYARHWEQLTVVFTAQDDNIVLITLSIEHDYLYDVYWDDVVVWTAAGGKLVTADGSNVQQVECYQSFETPQVLNSYTSCAEVKYANEPDGSYQITDVNGVDHNYYCRDEFGGGQTKVHCDDVWTCYSCESIVHESGSWPAGFLSNGLATFSDAAEWASDMYMRIEWYDSSGDWQWVQFKTADSIFIDRPDTSLSGSASDNTIFPIDLSDFSTSDLTFLAAVTAADGAMFCFSTLDTSSVEAVAWGILPLTHDAHSAGCIGDGWQGQGVFYGDEYSGAGFVGYVEDGAEKALAGSAVHLDLNIFNCYALNSVQHLWLLCADLEATDTEWIDHRGTENGYESAITLSSVALDSASGAYRIDSELSVVTVDDLDMSPSEMEELTIVVWVRIESDPGSAGWLVSQDTGTGHYDRGLILHDTAFGDDGTGWGALVSNEDILPNLVTFLFIHVLTLHNEPCNLTQQEAFISIVQ